MIITGLDIETTGLEQADGHRIIEISMLCYRWPSRKPTLNYTQRVNPLRPIAPAAEAVHKIRLTDLAGKPKWEEVAPNVQKILKHTDLAVAHNGAEFDMPFIGMELIRIGLDLPELRTFDTMLNGRWATSTGKLPTLGELCFACGVPYDKSEAHAAHYDVEVMMECFFRGMDWMFFNPEISAHAKKELLAS